MTYFEMLCDLAMATEAIRSTTDLLKELRQWGKLLSIPLIRRASRKRHASAPKQDRTARALKARDSHGEGASPRRPHDRRLGPRRR